MFLLQRKYRPLLGLDITTSSVKLIELATAGGQYRVEAYAAEPTPQNAINEKAPESSDVLLVATRTENVEQRQAAVKAAGLTAKIVDVEAFALENACKLMTHQMPDGGIDRTIAVVDFGASSTTFSVLRNLKV